MRQISPAFSRRTYLYSAYYYNIMIYITRIVYIYYVQLILDYLGRYVFSERFDMHHYMIIIRLIVCVVCQCYVHCTLYYNYYYQLCTNSLTKQTENDVLLLSRQQAHEYNYYNKLLYTCIIYVITYNIFTAVGDLLR